MTIRPVPTRSSSPLLSDLSVGRLAAVLAVAFVLLLASGCDSSTPETTSAPAMKPIEVTGRYQMSGVTTTPGSDLKRKISGIMRIEQAGSLYKASYEFKTKFPGEGGSMDADVIGVGEGRVDGRSISGSARTQIVVSSVPGVDTGFAFAPRRVSARIVSTTTGEFDSEGILVIEIHSSAQQGESYQATHTRMRGRRIGDLRSMPKPYPKDDKAG
jgi:hypothetical protein